MAQYEDRQHDGPEEPERDELSSSETNGHVRFPDSPPPTPPIVKRRRRMLRGDVEEARPAGGKGTGKTAMDVWPELLAECKAQNKSLYTISVRVMCEDPPPSRPIGNAFGANAIIGDGSTSPGDRLYQYIRDNYHLTWARRACVYDIQFIDRDTGAYLRRGFLQLPDPEEIIALRQNEQRMGVYAAETSRQPAPVWQPPPVQQHQLPPQYPAAQPSGPRDVELEQVRAELQRERENNARLQGQQSELWQAVRDGRTPVMPTATPAPAQSDVETIVMRALERMGIKPPQQPQMTDTEAVVMRVLGALGIKPGVTPGVGVGAPPSTATPVDELTATAENFKRVLSTMQQFHGFSRQVGKMFGGEAVEATAELVDDAAGPDGAGKLPFDAVEIPQVKWSDGRPVMFAASRETGRLDPTGALFSNPAVIEKAAEGFTKFMGVLGKVVQAAVKAQGEPGAAEVVDEIPAGAQEATGTGGGWNGLG
jgi:hypothetical protein